MQCYTTRCNGFMPFVLLAYYFRKQPHFAPNMTKITAASITEAAVLSFTFKLHPELFGMKQSQFLDCWKDILHLCK